MGALVANKASLGSAFFTFGALAGFFSGLPLSAARTPAKASAKTTIEINRDQLMAL
jgi:hypothetical protein